MWGAIQVLQERMSRIDHAKLIACDLVTEITSHFEVIRESQTMRYMTIFYCKNLTTQC